ncbi:MAG: hypothetical protein PVF54_04095 [Anaerolineae bacterium]|jgi:hypothetical protein
MRVQPGRRQSLLVAIAMVLAMAVVLAMIRQFGGRPGGAFGPLMTAWMVTGLIGAAMAFYNAFSKKGLPLYEADDESEDDPVFCPECGRLVGPDVQSCRYCRQAPEE